MADPSKVIDYDFTQSTLAAAALVGPTLSFTRATSATHFDSDGVMQTAASGTARLASHAYNGTDWVNKGYLVEEQRTNECLQSEDFSTTWINGGSVITVNDAVAPDGATTADKIEDDSSGGFDNVRQVMSGIASDGETWTSSIFIKKDAIGKATRFLAYQLQYTTGTSTTGTVHLDTSTGETAAEVQAGTGVVIDSGAEDHEDYWRLFIAFQNNSTGNTTVTNFLYPAVGSGALLSSNHSATPTGFVHAWGAQTELGAFPTSYIPTTTTAVTRNADVLENTADIGALFNDNAGSVVIEARKIGELSNNSYLMSLDDGSDVDRWHILHATSGVEVRHFVRGTAGPVASGDVSVGTVALDTDVTVAAAFALNDANAAVDGTLGTQDTTVQVFLASAVDQLAIGIDNVGNINHYNGYIKTFAYFDERKSDAFLQSPDLARDEVTFIAQNPGLVSVGKLMART